MVSSGRLLGLQNYYGKMTLDSLINTEVLISKLQYARDTRMVMALA